METPVEEVAIVERPPEPATEQDHAHQRTIYRVGNSYVVPVPIWIRELLDRRDGGSVYWHEFRPGEAIISSQPVRTAGRPPGATAQKKIARLTRENLRLRRRLRARPLGILGEQISQVMMQAIKVGMPYEAQIRETLEVVKDIQARTPFRRQTRPYRAKRAAPAVELAPGPDTYAPPVPSSSPDSIGEGAGTSGAELPGAPLEE